MSQEFLGPENAKPNGVCATRFGFTDHGTNGRDGVRSSKAFTELVQRAQMAGYPVTWNDDGYFYATDPSHFEFAENHAEKMIAVWAAKKKAIQRAREALQPALV